MEEHPANPAFRHPGSLGDIVYSIPFCLACIGVLDGSALASGPKMDLWLDITMHHTQNGEGPALKALGMLADLLGTQPYVGKVEAARRTSWLKAGALDLGAMRDGRVSMRNGDILRRYHHLRRLPAYFDASTPWLVTDDPAGGDLDWVDGRIGVWRTPRYRNGAIRSYSALGSWKGGLVYFGTEREQLDFRRESGLDARLFEGDFRAVCRAMRRCAFVVGNQTFMFSLAEAIKVPRLLEMSTAIPDVMPLGPMANAFVDQRDFETCLAMYAERLS